MNTKAVGVLACVAAAMTTGMGVCFGATNAARMRAVYTVPHELDVLVTKDYFGHIQGATCSEKAIYLSHAYGIFKIDWKSGKLLKSCFAPSHLGDIAYDGKGHIYGAFGLKNPPKGKSTLMVGVWDEDLNLVKEAYIDPPVENCAYFDGALVMGDTFYTGIDHYAQPGNDHPPHNDLTVIMLSIPDLKVKGTREILFDYPIHYGCQTLGTDGKNILFGNYGATSAQGNTKGLNFSRTTGDFNLLESRRFAASEGFGLVPKSVTGRDDIVFFNVNALGGNMQGWEKDPINNPPRIRIDFWSYDEKTGELTNITDRTDPLAYTIADWGYDDSSRKVETTSSATATAAGGLASFGADCSISNRLSRFRSVSGATRINVR